MENKLIRLFFIFNLNTSCISKAVRSRISVDNFENKSLQLLEFTLTMWKLDSEGRCCSLRRVLYPFTRENDSKVFENLTSVGGI